VSVKRDSVAAYRCLGAALAEQGRPEDAVACYRNGSFTGDAGLKVRLATVLPAIARSSEDLQRWRSRFESEITRLIDTPLRLTDPAKDVGCANFFLSYHGLSNRSLNIKLGELYRRACPSLLWTAPHCMAARRTSGKLRVGFISRFLRNHSIGKTTRGLLANLSRDQFEAIALFVPPVHDDELTRLIRAASDQALTLPRTLDAARESIAQLKLDVLFYQTSAWSRSLISLPSPGWLRFSARRSGIPTRLALPIWTTSCPNDLYETAQAQEHYSERLFLLRDLGTLAYYYRPRLAHGAKRREDFGLPARANLYLCPQTLFKFHPDFDAVLAEVLRGDPGGRVVLIEGETAMWRELLHARLRAACPDVAETGHFSAAPERTDFSYLIEACDVMLDTLHFNGMNTSLEAFAVGTPVVTLPTALQRGRHTAGMYIKMGLDDCVAKDRDDYVRIALALGTEEDKRRQTKQEILQRNHVLFEDLRAVREFERFFLEAQSGL